MLIESSLLVLQDEITAAVFVSNVAKKRQGAQQGS